MSTETQPKPVSSEELQLPAEYQFLSVDNIDDIYRDTQRKNQNNALADALNSDDVYTATKDAEEKLLDGSEAEAEQYLSLYLKREDNPELYDRLKQLIAGVSYYNMDGVEWHLGEPDEQGKHYKHETSGRDQYEAALKELFGDKPEDDEPEEPKDDEPKPDDEDEEEKGPSPLEALIAARKELAALSVERRKLLRKGGKKNKKLEEQYTEAQKRYDEALQAAGVAMVTDMRQDGATDTDIRAEIVRLTLTENQEFSAAQREAIGEKDSLRWRLATKLANKKGWLTGFSVANGAVFGTGARFVGKGMVVLGSGILLPVAVASAVAIRTTKAIIGSSVGNLAYMIRDFDKTAVADHKRLESHAKELDGSTTHEAFIQAAAGLLNKNITGRVDADRKRNQARVLKAVALSAGAAVAAEFVTDYFKGSGSDNHAASTQKPNYNDTIPPNQNPPKPGTLPYQQSGGHHGGGHGQGSGNHGGGHGNGNQGGNHGGGTPPQNGSAVKVHIGDGEGYQQMYADIARQNGIHVNDAQTWYAVTHTEGVLENNPLKGDTTYMFHGDPRIQEAGDFELKRKAAKKILSALRAASKK